ncbi:ABC transporter permease [Salinadaptatus halalkaliphilus]|uniref:ABC transporter permease n=1 Tax=Salinadaptatus halalkaliphilus TaxID=2419781 RepID=A0A4S3TKQ9_9EURY|nr:ABC transporter permease [Salinadaptatus halalkaliphilus]THE63168.1 ABC transporter permease [Salinadaptatus halalkaliphilus]
MFSKRTLQSLRDVFHRSLLPKIGLICLLLVVVSGIFAPVLAPHDPTAQNSDISNQPPVMVSQDVTEETVELDGLEQEVTQETVTKTGTLAYPLGTDPLGRDILSRIIYGARVSLVVGIVSTLLAFMLGTAFGLTSGYYGGWVDDLFMRLIEVRLSIPGLVLAIAIIGIFGSLPIPVPDPFVSLGITPDMPETTVIPGAITLVIAVFSWDHFARVARGEALSLRSQNYVQAAKASGASSWAIIRRHLYPNALTPVMVLATIRVASAIILESVLSFLGFSGVTLSWGFDIAFGREYMGTAWWVALFPGLAIVVAVIGVNLMGDWLRDALDPDVDAGGAVE